MPQPSKKPPAKKSAGARTKKVVKKVAKNSVKPVAKKALTKRAKKSTKKSTKKGSATKTPAKGLSIVETSTLNWSPLSTGPSFEQVQLAAYHRWLQGGAGDLENWLSAEGDLRGKKR